ncbi:MAG: right-handed parallel beta-helix repeat-containing protein [Muribaculaceae bacterium]|nr:right-handed parallel beta-helix repeat-containing protein [Muribaculaceae bacterium]
MKTILSLIFLSVISVCLLSSCMEDGFDTSPSAQPVFSVDTLDMGITFTEQPTPTHRFTVHNRHSKLISISRIALRDDAAPYFRINVDGFAGTEFSNVEIRPNDSIYVFVEATLPPNSTPVLTDVTAHLDFTTNGVTSGVVLLARGQDVERRRGYVVETDERWDATMPYQIYDSLVVAPGATLTLDPGVSLHFHDKAELRVRGTLISEGTPENPVNMTGDRTDNVVGDISFDLMASQWEGVWITPESRRSHLSHTIIRNTVNGVVADSLSQVTFLNCRLRNAAGYPLLSRYADVTLLGTEVAEGGSGLFAMMGGNVVANHCTFANYYLFSALGGPALQFYHYDSDSDNASGMPYLKADISNSIVYGNGSDLNKADLAGTDIYVRTTVLKSSGTDDDHFINCMWDTDPLYGTVRQDYFFDYRLHSDSPVIGQADPQLTRPEATTDFYGINRLPNPTPGAYQMLLPED